MNTKTRKPEAYLPSSLLEAHGLLNLAPQTAKERSREIAKLLKKAEKLNAKWEKMNKE